MTSRSRAAGLWRSLYFLISLRADTRSLVARGLAGHARREDIGAALGAPATRPRAGPLATALRLLEVPVLRVARLIALTLAPIGAGLLTTSSATAAPAAVQAPVQALFVLPRGAVVAPHALQPVTGLAPCGATLTTKSGSSSRSAPATAGSGTERRAASAFPWASAPSSEREPSRARYLAWGAGLGGLAGGALGLVVVSFADCVGANCGVQRAVGVGGSALVGAGFGALIGAVEYRHHR